MPCILAQPELKHSTRPPCWNSAVQEVKASVNDAQNNEKKPRLEPNYSFDLCRLACSIFDYLVEDFDEIKDLI